jgi:hypothetical protein
MDVPTAESRRPSRTDRCTKEPDMDTEGCDADTVSGLGDKPGPARRAMHLKMEAEGPLYSS